MAESEWDGERPVALVTGGSRGIGRAVVEQLARDGYDIAFCGHAPSPAAEETARRVEKSGAACLHQPCDVADAAAVGRFVKRVEDELGPVRTLVNSAGVVRDKNLVMMADEDWTTVLETNLTGTFNLCRAVGFHMLRRRRGAIVNISSVAGVQGQVGQANYAASKGGVNSLTRTLAKEFARHGVRVNAVAPGFVATEMLDELSDSARKKALESVPMRRFGTVEDVAGLTGFLVSERASYITGQVLQVDGGVLL
ncbi:3-oxoacyl-ACP reductase FabG [Streptomyces sulphureus]|uniref:3-oxoacyl-ACP reductase FabG n=1 Tax=Streptomyces sulphureus TaxID=47758 RepID=UPI000377ECC7|nr:3-oxoacyl-ACP reductase FabG [Streptomyces sulphureus]